MLTDLICRNAKPGPKPRKLADAKSLYLFVTPSGSKLWRYDYSFEGRRKTLSLGAYPKVTLATARAMRDNAKKTVESGFDPAASRHTLDGHNSFRALAKQWLDAQSVSWVDAHTERVWNRFERDIFPVIGDKPIDEIAAPDILKALRSVEQRGALDVTKRIRQSTSAVFRYAIALGLASHDPAADLVDALKARPKVKHMAALEADELGEFLRKLAGYDGGRQTRLAIELVLHTMLRTNEVRFGTWAEIKGDQWLIPDARMKMSRDHLVPLTKQSKRILAELREIAGDSEWIVPGAGGRKPISQNTMIYALYRLGYHSRLTVHGLRSTASTILNDSNLWTPDAIERQLAHVPENKVRSAYNRAEYWPERVRMMQWWSAYVTAAHPHDLSALLD